MHLGESMPVGRTAWKRERSEFYSLLGPQMVNGQLVSDRWVHLLMCKTHMGALAVQVSYSERHFPVCLAHSRCC